MPSKESHKFVTFCTGLFSTLIFISIVILGFIDRPYIRHAIGSVPFIMFCIVIVLFIIGRGVDNDGNI